MGLGRKKFKTHLIAIYFCTPNNTELCSLHEFLMHRTQHEKESGEKLLLGSVGGNVSFTKLLDGNLDKSTVMCKLCKKSQEHLQPLLPPQCQTCCSEHRERS